MLSRYDLFYRSITGAVMTLEQLRVFVAIAVLELQLRRTCRFAGCGDA
jgi:hypothetical protein